MIKAKEFEDIKITQKQFNDLFLKLTLRTRNECIWCKKKFDKPLVLDVDGVLNTEFLIHSKQTHGYLPEEVLDMLNNVEL